MTNIFKAFTVVWFAVFAFCIAFWAVAGYVAYHFISKVW